MATLATGKTWLSGDQVTPGGLNQMVNSATISGIVNADIAAGAAIQLSKLATGALPTAITVASANIVDGTIVNTDISGVAGISHSKLAAVGAGQVLIGDAVTGTLTARTMTGDATLANNGIITIANGAVTSAKIADGTIVDGDISGTAAINKTKISGTAITAADTGTVTSAMIANGTIVNADINASAAIEGSKIDPQFTSASTITVNSATDPALRITQTGAANAFVVFDEAADTSPFVIGPTGSVGIGTTAPSSKLQVVGDILASDPSGQVFVDASAGSLELFGSSAFIDFKDNAADDYDCRIIQNSNGLRIETGGNGSTATRVEVKSGGQVRFIPLAANPANAEAGDMYYNSVTNSFFYYNGTAWTAM